MELVTTPAGGMHSVKQLSFPDKRTPMIIHATGKQSHITANTMQKGMIHPFLLCTKEQ